MELSALVNILKFAAPVGLASLGETVGQRSGVINIGLEGMMLVAAYFAMWGSQATGSPWLGLLIGVLAAVVLGAVQAAFTVGLAADQVVVGTAVNLFALGLTGTLFRLQFGQSGALVSVPTLPTFLGGWDVVLVGFLASVGVVAWLLRRSKWGLALRGSGEYPDAVEASGYSVNRLRLGALAVGAVFAGLAGAYLAVGITGSFAENMTLGRGFVAIAMVTFGRWRPWGVFGASLLVGFAESLQYTLQARGLGVPVELLIALPYLLALAVLVVVGRGTAVPAALGRPYRREK